MGAVHASCVESLHIAQDHALRSNRKQRFVQTNEGEDDGNCKENRNQKGCHHSR